MDRRTKGVYAFIFFTQRAWLTLLSRCGSTLGEQLHIRAQALPSRIRIYAPSRKQSPSAFQAPPSRLYELKSLPHKAASTGSFRSRVHPERTTSYLVLTHGLIPNVLHPTVFSLTDSPYRNCWWDHWRFQMRCWTARH